MSSPFASTLAVNRTAFGNANKRSSRKSQPDSGRLPDSGRPTRDSLDDILVRPADKSASEEAKAARRRASLAKMTSSGLDNGVGAALSDDLCAADGAVGDAKSKMDAVLKLAKEKGLTSEKIFEYFDTNGDGVITKEEFKVGLYNLDKIRFKLDDDQIDELVALFDKDGDGQVDMQEFKDYCFSMKNLAWRAEKLRKNRMSESAPSLLPPIDGAAPAPAAAP